MTSFHQFLERKMLNIYNLEPKLTRDKDSEGGHFHIDGEKPAHKLVQKKICLKLY